MINRRGTSKRQGQLSLEALLSLLALLMALSIIALSVKNSSHLLTSASEKSAERFSLSYLAFCTDEAAQSLSNAHFTLKSSALPLGGGNKLSSMKRMSLQEFIFHNASASQEGTIHVRSNREEPI